MAAAVREELSALGYSVGVLEVVLVQKDLAHAMLQKAEDWVSGRAIVVDFMNSYSNFVLSQLARDDLRYKFAELTERVDEIVEQNRPSRPRVGEPASGSSSAAAPPALRPRQPSHPPPPAPASASGALADTIQQSGLPVPPAPPASEHEFSQADLDLIQAYQLDDGAISSLRRLAARSVDAMDKVLGKLRRKSDIGRPSQFVTVACKNAMDKLR